MIKRTFFPEDLVEAKVSNLPFTGTVKVKATSLYKGKEFVSVEFFDEESQLFLQSLPFESTIFRMVQAKNGIRRKNQEFLGRRKERKDEPAETFSSSDRTSSKKPHKAEEVENLQTQHKTLQIESLSFVKDLPFPSHKKIKSK